MFWRRPPPQRAVIDFDRAMHAIVQVGKNGRGFMCGGHIVTAASCLPRFSAFKPFDSKDSFEYKKILGRLGEAPSIAAQCEFADIVSNVAVLREIPPTLEERYDGQYELTNWAIRFPVSAPKQSPIASSVTQQPAWVLSLEGIWVKCLAENHSSGIRILELPFELDGRLSGSPIVDEGGAAIGIICVPIKNADRKNWIDIHPVAARCLPTWLAG